MREDRSKEKGRIEGEERKNISFKVGGKDQAMHACLQTDLWIVLNVIKGGRAYH